MSYKKDQAKEIIHTAAVACAATAGALAQGAVVGADTPILIGIQTQMIKDLAELLDHDMEAADVVAYIGQNVGAHFGVAGAKALLGALPGLGNAANAAVTLTHTEALGWAAYKYFGGD